MAYTFGSTPVGNLGGKKKNNAEAFRANEAAMLTSYGGTAGDAYYKNPQGTGTGQGGSGIITGDPSKDKSESTTSNNKSTAASAPVNAGSVNWTQGASLKEDEKISGNFLGTALRNASVEELAELSKQNPEFKQFLVFFDGLKDNQFVTGNETGASNVAKAGAALTFANTPVGNLAGGNTGVGAGAGVGAGSGAASSSITTSAQNAEAFRANEANMLTNYGGTAGDQYYKNEQGTGTGQISTATTAGAGTGASAGAQLGGAGNYVLTNEMKEQFRQNEENYLTNYSGTAGDNYYINEQGTGTGQGGTGIYTGGNGTGGGSGGGTGGNGNGNNTTTTTTITTTNGGGGNNDTTPTQEGGSATKVGGGGSATDVEYIPDAPQTIEVPKRRRKFKGKRGLRLQANALNIPTGTGSGSGSGLNIPT